MFCLVKPFLSQSLLPLCPTPPTNPPSLLSPVSVSLSFTCLYTHTHTHTSYATNTCRFHVDDLDEDVFEDLSIERTETGKYNLTGQVSLHYSEFITCHKAS